MVNEMIKPKTSAVDRIDSIIQKMELQHQVECWQEIGDRIHKRLDDNLKKLASLENQLLKKETE